MFTKFCTTLAFAALITGVAGPLAADSMEFAIEHFNASEDRASDHRTYSGPAGLQVTASAMDGRPVGFALDILNASASRAGDIQGERGVTIVSGQPSHAAEIFDRLHEESRDND